MPGRDIWFTGAYSGCSSEIPKWAGQATSVSGSCEYPEGSGGGEAFDADTSAMHQDLSQVDAWLPSASMRRRTREGGFLRPPDAIPVYAHRNPMNL